MLNEDTLREEWLEIEMQSAAVCGYELDVARNQMIANHWLSKLRQERERLVKELEEMKKGLDTDTNGKGICNPRCHDSQEEMTLNHIIKLLGN